MTSRVAVPRRNSSPGSSAVTKVNRIVKTQLMVSEWGAIGIEWESVGLGLLFTGSKRKRKRVECWVM